MSDDLVKRLNCANLYEGHGELSALPEEAAAEITRLRAQVRAADVLAYEVRRRAGWTDLNTALATYQQAKETRHEPRSSQD